MTIPRMPTRDPQDGPVKVKRYATTGNFLILYSTYEGREESICVSEYNAWRLFGLLSVTLGLRLAKQAREAIDLGGYGTGAMTFVERDKP